jgi:hypothetical protein
MNRYNNAGVIYSWFAVSCLCILGLMGCQTVQKAAVPRPAVAVRPHTPTPTHSAEAGAAGIDWNEWSNNVFARAASGDKLIFLDISATWCHWCEVMDETAYADPDVIKFINENFIPVYVDTDLRPDINDRYNQGGWPSIVILSNEGRVLGGNTTMSASELMRFAGDVRDAYFENRDKVEATFDVRDEAIEAARKEIGAKRTEKPLGPEMPVSVLRTVNMFVDPNFGGFGGPQKFPYPTVMEFALALYPKVKDNEEYSPKRAIELTLDGMASGLYDPLEGGFFRYATTQDWKNPHYEKLLETNGDLLGVYMTASRELGYARYRRVLQQPEGGRALLHKVP